MASGLNQAFVRDLLGCQRSLYAYLYKLTLDTAVAQEVLQEANVVLLSKQEEYAAVEHFGAWAARIAHFQLLAYRKRHGRERQRFSPALVELLADEGVSSVDSRDPKLEALGQCLQKLSPADRELVDQRYHRDLSSQQIADRLQRTSRAITQSLYRIRMALAECIRQRLASEGI